MRTSITFSLFLCALLFTAGCSSSTPQDRISRNREAYRRFPSNVQRMVSAGMVDVGFTPEMVRMAAGEPSRVLNRQTESDNTEVWVYLSSGTPRVSVGFGVGSFGRHSASSVGVGTTTGGNDPQEKLRVVFRDGHVTEVEYRKG